MSQELEGESMDLTVRNIGGIDEADISFSPGITLLTGPNATNRTSLLTAIADVLGGSAASLKSDSEEGWIEATIAGEEDAGAFTCRYERSGGTVSVDRNPYSDRTTLVDLFVSLLENNAARQAVEHADAAELREVIMEPVDTDEIQRQLRSLRQERQEVVDRLEQIERVRDDLPRKEERRNSLRDELSETKSEIEQVEEKIDQHEAEVEEAEAAEALVDELDDLRENQLDIQRKIESREGKIEDLRDEIEGIDESLDELSVSADEIDEVESELSQLNSRRNTLESEGKQLRRVIEFNEEMLEEGGNGFSAADSSEDRDPTAALDPMSETVECWTCGSQVERSVIHDRLDGLREQLEQGKKERNEVSRQADQKQSEYKELRQIRERRQSLEQRRDDLTSQLDQAEKRVEGLTTELESVRQEVSDLEEEIDETEELRESDLLEQYRRLSDLEYERGQTERELESLEKEIERLDSLTDEREQLEAQRAELSDELSGLRTRIEDLEQAAIEGFNEHMGAILELLEYRNIERVWIERKTKSGSSAAASEFELHVIRTADDDTVYEDTVDTLSESEREVIGLVLGLAGYLAHDVHEEVPFILLDSLEAIDANRLARLVEYFGRQATYVVVALLPEDASQLDDGAASSDRSLNRISADAIGA